MKIWREEPGHWRAVGDRWTWQMMRTAPGMWRLWRWNVALGRWCPMPLKPFPRLEDALEHVDAID